MFRGFPADVAGTDTPNGEEVRHREKGERDVRADDEDGDEHRAPDVHVEHHLECFLTNGRREHPEEPARHDQHVNCRRKEQVGGLLTAVVATLRRNFHGAQGDVEEATGVAAEVEEPAEGVAVPGEAGVHHQRETIRRKEDVAEEAERESDTEADVPKHERFARGGFEITQVHDGAGDDEREPQDGWYVSYRQCV